MLIDFKKNLSDTDRIIRFIVGLILVSLAVTQTIKGIWATLAIVLAIFQFVEALFAY